MSAALRNVFEQCGKQGRAAFIGYLTCGYPTPAETIDLLLAMQQGGCDVIELGVPFSDPMADGTTIQHSNFIALQQHISLRGCLAIARDARKAGLKVPLLLMGYVNPILRYGEARLVRDAKESGVNGFIVVDLPIEEASVFLGECKKEALSFVPLVAPTTRDARIEALAQVADSFMYCVSVAGVTGQRDSLPQHLESFLKRVRQHSKVPLAVGFGISTPQHAAQVSKIADGVVVGSAIIRTITDAADKDTRCTRVREYVAKMVAPTP